jgi:hypothetical protein
MLLSEDDAKKVAKMMENQISGLNRERKQAARQERADQELPQVQYTSTVTGTHLIRIPIGLFSSRWHVNNDR